MTDSTTFETRLTDALDRYADGAPTDVDPALLARSLTIAASEKRIVGRPAFGRDGRLSVAALVLVVASIGGLALFGGQLLQPSPPVVLSPSPSSPVTTASPSPNKAIASATALPRPPAFAWTSASLPGGKTLNNVVGLWYVGNRFVAVASPQWNDGIDPHLTSILRSDDGIVWEAVPTLTRGLEIHTGVVEDGVLWLVGSIGPMEAPRWGIWTTRDGEAWERVKDLTGLAFGAGFVRDISHSSAGWLVLAYRRLDAESSVPELYRSEDGVRWAKVALPTNGFALRSLVSDRERWIMTLNESREGDTQVLGHDVWAYTSLDGLEWTRSLVASTERGTGLPASINSADATFGPGGFVIVGQHVDGEIPDPVAWRSADGTTWTSGRMDGLTGTAGETGLDQVAATDRGYVAVGYREEEIPTFWTSPDGLSWTQTEDSPDIGAAGVASLAASDTRVVLGGQLPDGIAFVWSATR